MNRKLSNILVTGGMGFIGSNFIRSLLEENNFSGRIINLDALTYAGNPENLIDIENKYGSKYYFFEKGNICNRELLDEVFKKYEIDTVINFAAESHVDRSILKPVDFVETNVIGTFTLLESARDYWKKSVDSFRDDVLFHHISTDEVYGSLGETGSFSETTPYAPHSPYSASKAASDFLVISYFHTYGLPVTLSNCSNNYGPYQFPEKFIPLMILNMLSGKPLPVYGDGKNIRDWIYVSDHNNAVWTILQRGIIGEKYNIGGENELENIKLLEYLINVFAVKSKYDQSKICNTITFIKDRPGHDRRYAINCSKIKKELCWKQKFDFKKGLELTVDWYLSNKNWIQNVTYQKN